MPILAGGAENLGGGARKFGGEASFCPSPLPLDRTLHTHLQLMRHKFHSVGVGVGCMNMFMIQTFRAFSAGVSSIIASNTADTDTPYSI